jgi:hypothetical protein
VVESHSLDGPWGNFNVIVALNDVNLHLPFGGSQKDSLVNFQLL